MATKSYYETHQKYRVYILKLQDGCYYVGISADVESRYRQHTGEKRGGAEWTALHRPEEMIFTSGGDVLF